MNLFLLGLTTFMALAALGLSVTNRRKLDALAGRIAALEARSISPAGSNSKRIKPRTASPTRRVARVEPANLNRPTLISVPNLAAKRAGPLSPSELEQRFASIWAMADAGVSAEVIARETGQPIGQVELILGLKRPRAATGGSPRS